MPSHVAYQVKYTDAYDAQLAAQCRKFANCRYDGNAAARIAVTAAEMSSDQEHLSVQGQAKLAATEWTAMSAFLRRHLSARGRAFTTLSSRTHYATQDSETVLVRMCFGRCSARLSKLAAKYHKRPANREADARIRTADPFITSEVLYQLSYVGADPSVAAGAIKRVHRAGCAFIPRLH